MINALAEMVKNLKIVVGPYKIKNNELMSVNKKNIVKNINFFDLKSNYYS